LIDVIAFIFRKYAAKILIDIADVPAFVISVATVKIGAFHFDTS